MGQGNLHIIIEYVVATYYMASGSWQAGGREPHCSKKDLNGLKGMMMLQ